MKRLIALTLFGLFAISCITRQNSQHMHSSKGATMTYSVGTQAEADATNQRIQQFKQELLRQGFHEVSASFSDSQSNSQEEFILEGQYGNLTDLRVTLRTAKRMQSESPPFAGAVNASIKDDQAERDFVELYKKVCTVVTGQAESCTRNDF